MSLRVVPVCVLALISFSAVAFAQSCPNNLNYGAALASTQREGETRRVNVEVTYFRTVDPGSFVAERNGLVASSSTARLSAQVFRQHLEKFVGEGSAFVDGAATKDLVIGEVSEVNLLRSTVSESPDRTSFSHARFSAAQTPVFERTTSLRVSKRANESSPRIDLRSYFIQSTGDDNAERIPDLDASSLIGVGETVVYKLTSDNEVARSKGWRTYIALTVRAAPD
jgi:hypothetical protein